MSITTDGSHPRSARPARAASRSSTARLRVARARRLRRARRHLRHHRRARAGARARRRRQGDQPAGRAARRSRHQPFGHVLLIAVAIGLGGYAALAARRAPRSATAPRRSDSTFDRIAALASGIAYADLCVTGDRDPAAARRTSQLRQHRTRRRPASSAGPAGRGSSAPPASRPASASRSTRATRASRKKFLDDSKTERDEPRRRSARSPRSASSGTWRGWSSSASSATSSSRPRSTTPRTRPSGWTASLARLVHDSYGPVLLGDRRRRPGRVRAVLDRRRALPQASEAHHDRRLGSTLPARPRTIVRYVDRRSRRSGCRPMRRARSRSSARASAPGASTACTSRSSPSTGWRRGSDHPYEVRSTAIRSGRRSRLRLPAQHDAPAARRRERGSIFGSCRIALPHEPPYVLRAPRASRRAGDRRAARLRAASARGRAARPRCPDMLLMLGDQIYADEPSPALQAAIARPPRAPTTCPRTSSPTSASTRSPTTRRGASRSSAGCSPRCRRR